MPKPIKYQITHAKKHEEPVVITRNEDELVDCVQAIVKHTQSKIISIVRLP